MKLKLINLIFCVFFFQQISFAGGALKGLNGLEFLVYWIISMLVVYILFLIFRWRNRTKPHKVSTIGVYVILFILALLFMFPLFMTFKNGLENVDSEEVVWLIITTPFIIAAIVAMVQTYNKDKESQKK